MKHGVCEEGVIVSVNPYWVEENGSMCRRRFDRYWARDEDQSVFGRNRIWKAFVRLYRMGCFVWRDEERVVGFMDWMR